MSRRRRITLLVLAIWAVCGPVAMAFTGCALMGGMCEGPCGAFSSSVRMPETAATPAPVEQVAAQPQGPPPAGAPGSLEPPPKPLPGAA